MDEASAIAQQVSDSVLRDLVVKQLGYMLHAMQCFDPGCHLSYCITMKGVLEHIKTCNIGVTCKFGHCLSTGQILHHYSTCSAQTCLICSPFRKWQNLSLGVVPNQPQQQM